MSLVDPDSPFGHKALGYYHYWGHRDYELALEEFATAAAGLPHDSEIAEGIGYVWRRQGRFDEAIAQLKKALEPEPRDAGLALNLADTYSFPSAFPDADRSSFRSRRMRSGGRLWCGPWSLSTRWWEMRRLPWIRWSPCSPSRPG